MVMVRSALVAGCDSQEADQTVHLGRSELHPLAADVDQWCLELGQPEQLGLVDLLVAQCGLPVEGADAVLGEQATRAGTPGRGGGRGGLEPNAQAGLGPPPPRRQEHAEPGHLEGRRGLHQEAMGAVQIEGETRRRGLAQRLAQLGVDAHRPAQLGQEDLMRSAERSAGPLQLVAGPPDLFGADDQAEIVGGLQKELQRAMSPIRRRPGRRSRATFGALIWWRRFRCMSSMSSPALGSWRRRHSLQDPPRAAASARHSPTRRSNLASSPVSATTRGEGDARAVSQDSSAGAAWSAPARGNRMRERREAASDVPAHGIDERVEGVMDDPLWRKSLGGE